MPRRPDTGHRRRATDQQHAGTDRDAEGTERTPEVRQALEAGQLDAPPADEPRGRWGE